MLKGSTNSVGLQFVVDEKRGQVNGVILSYIGYPKAVFDCPLVSHVATTTTF